MKRTVAIGAQRSVAGGTFSRTTSTSFLFGVSLKRCGFVSHI